MECGASIRLECERETLEALASGLTHYGPDVGEPEWLVAGAWLCTKDRKYLATASVQVLPDGFVARSLNIRTPEDFARHLQAELPDVAARVTARGNGITLPPAEAPSPPGHLATWSTADYDTEVLVRTTRCATGHNRVACALLFTTKDGRALLVGSDPSTLALVLSEDPDLIDRYRNECALLTLTQYLAEP